MANRISYLADLTLIRNQVSSDILMIINSLSESFFTKTKNYPMSISMTIDGIGNSFASMILVDRSLSKACKITICSPDRIGFRFLSDPGSIDSFMGLKHFLMHWPGLIRIVSEIK